MIEGWKVRLWDRRYDIVEDGRTVAIWERSLWGTGGTVQLDGRRFQVRTTLPGGESSMAEGTGRPVAVAHAVGRKNWAIESDGRTHHFRRSSPWRQEEQRHDGGGRPVGRIRRTSLWRGDAVADLPGLPRTVELYALALVLSRWESDSAATG
mgnify:CR=1 FL=1